MKRNLDKKYYSFPIDIYISINEAFFANIEWYLYKYFNIKRKYPCGIKRNKYNCCHQPLKEERIYLSEDKKECFCKVCGVRRIASNREIDIEKLWDF